MCYSSPILTCGRMTNPSVPGSGTADPFCLLEIVPPGPGCSGIELGLGCGTLEFVPIGQPVISLEPHRDPVAVCAQHSVQRAAGEHELLASAGISDPVDEGVDCRVGDSRDVAASRCLSGLRSINDAQTVS